MKKNYLTAVALSVLFLFPMSAMAIPSLGVATSTYNNQEADQAYVDYFAPYNVTLDPPDEQGFIWDGSEDLSIWAGQDSGKSNPDGWESTEVFLVTNSAAGNNFSIDGIGTFSDWQPGYQIDGYHRAGGDTYYRISLGYIDTWAPLVDPSFPGQWYNKTLVELDAPGFLLGDWLFAIADFDSLNGIYPLEENRITGGEFSPKTTSASPVPEPATMLLLGVGLIGIAGLGRKKLIKK